MTEHSVGSAKIDNGPECIQIHMDHNSRCTGQLQLHFSAEFGVFCNSLISVNWWGFGWVWFIVFFFGFGHLTFHKQSMT